jgi:hypothetical protein
MVEVPAFTVVIFIVTLVVSTAAGVTYAARRTGAEAAGEIRQQSQRILSKMRIERRDVYKSLDEGDAGDQSP